MFSIEPHGNGMTLYFGRDDLHHGYNLGTISEVSYNALEILNAPLKRIDELEAENAELRSHPITDETIKHDFQLLMEQRDRLAADLAWISVSSNIAFIHKRAKEALASLDQNPTEKKNPTGQSKD